jgi:glycerol-3-phosphate dehydrogenase
MAALRAPRGHKGRRRLDEPVVELSRDRALAALSERRFDLLVIGGGIIGAGIACEAARVGLAVALVERTDFASGTSSASSKLIHGGLRYLRLGDIRLVREAHAERRALMQVVAPHLVRRLSFLMPLYRDAPYRPRTLQAGLWLYSTLARERLGGLVPPERAHKAVPAIRLDGLRACGLYSDSWTNDSRLCLANVRGAADAGATVANYVEVRELRDVAGRLQGAEAVDCLTREAITVSARAVVNATGPWVDRVRLLEDPAAAPSSRLSKGVHVTLPMLRPWSAALTIPHDKVRVSFAVPWEGMLLLGTTDTLYDGEPGDVAPTPEDVQQVLDEASTAVDPDLLHPEAVLSTFAGLRVLPGTGKDTASVRRETVLLRGTKGMVSVAGGKLTTYRRIALDTIEALGPELGIHRLDRAPKPLPGAADPGQAARRLARQFPQLAPDVRAHLVHAYGTLAEEVLAPTADRPELLERLHPDAPELVAQAAYAREAEWACTPEDVLRRRTTLALRGLTLADVAGIESPP